MALIPTAWFASLLLAWLVPCGVAILAARDDVTALRLPNRHALFLLGLFPLAALGTPAVSFPSGLAAACLVLLPGLVLFAGHIVGGGDVKLAAAMALYLGLGNLGAFLLAAALVSGLLALVTLVVRRRVTLPPDCSSQDDLPRHWLDRARRGEAAKVPVGLALAVPFVVLLTVRFARSADFLFHRSVQGM